jgi:hypothetical protein
MICFRKIPIAAFLVGAAMLGSPAFARADLEIALQEAGFNGGLRTVVATGTSFTSTSFSGTYGDFTVSIFGGSADNTASLSDLLSSTTKVTNNSGQSKTLQLWATQTDFTLPAGSPLFVESGLGGSVAKGTVGLTGIFQAYADKNNNLFGTTDFTNGLQDATASGSTFDTGSTKGIFTRSGNYSLTSVANFTLSGGGKANFSDHINVTTPAPAAVVLILSGLPFLGIGTWLHRRKAKVRVS